MWNTTPITTWNQGLLTPGCCNSLNSLCGTLTEETPWSFPFKYCPLTLNLEVVLGIYKKNLRIKKEVPARKKKKKKKKNQQILYTREPGEYKQWRWTCTWSRWTIYGTWPWVLYGKIQLRAIYNYFSAQGEMMIGLGHISFHKCSKEIVERGSHVSVAQEKPWAWWDDKVLSTEPQTNSSIKSLHSALRCHSSVMLMTSRCIVLASWLSFKLKSQLPTVHIHLSLTHRYLILNDVETEHIFLPGAALRPCTCLWCHWTWNLRVILDIPSSSLSPESVSHERLMWIIKCWFILLSPWLATQV